MKTKQISGNHRNGRPSRAGQLHIQKQLRPFFERGISASLTAKKTENNIKTVCKYFDFWAQEISELEENDFLERQKKERNRILVSFDKQILEAYDLLDYINEEIKKLREQDKTVPRHYLSSKLDVMRYISSLVEKKGSFAMQLTMDESLEKKIGEMIRKHENTRSDS